MSGDTSHSTFSSEDAEYEDDLTTPTRCLFYGENVLFTLRSKSPPVLNGQIQSPIPDEADFRSVTLLTDERILIGSLSLSKWRNVQIRYEDITAITSENISDSEHDSIVTIETERCTVEIPTTSRIVSRTIPYMEKQVLESLMKSGERLVAAAEVVESISGPSSAEPVYRQAKDRLKRAETWGKNHGLSIDGLPSAMIDVQKKINRVRLSEEDDVQDSSEVSAEEDESQMRKWTSGLERESLIDELSTLSDDLGRFPKASELRRSDIRFSLRDYQKVFGSWDEALAAAGIDKREALLGEFRRVTRKLGKAPTTVEMDKHGAYSSGMYYSVFDSWSDVKEAADVDPTGETSESLSNRRNDDGSVHNPTAQEGPVVGGERKTSRSEGDDILEEIKREFDELPSDETVSSSGGNKDDIRNCSKKD